VPKSSAKLVPALVRGAQVLDVVATSKRGLNVTDIAKELGIAKSSAHGLCVTLTALNLLDRKLDQTYMLGPHIMRWSNRFTLESDVATEFAAIWDSSTNLPGATITLSVLEGTEVVYIAARNAELSVEYDFRIGMRLPAVFTATGKSLLSHKSNIDLKNLIGDVLPQPLTDYGVRDIDTLLSELDEVRRNGYSIDNQQVKEGMVCYGASVVNSLNKPVAGVAVSLSVEAVSKVTEAVIIKNLRDISKKISFRLGAELEGDL